ncbi:hypothetical protein JCM33374_g3092 [Metschnikowia sp. JCM 33374]|nr:hypothetical protein JCM33374_g3092 [Metschnikowia sp. JCM 33374]
MNLMDLLSSDSNTVPPEQDFNNLNNLSNYNEYTSFYGGDLQNIPEDVDPAKNPSTVYYLPTEMCSLQKDMSEAVIQMFTSTLSAELFPRRERSNINSLLSGPDDAVNGSHDTGPQSRAKIVSLIYNQLLTISMHPSLVVDHFISKGLLLSSTKARIRSFSGKLALFDKIIDLVSEKYEMETPSEDYNLMVIAKSIKELELIEGLVVGKKLRYQNVSSGKCLYEESRKTNRLDKDDLPTTSRQANTNTDTIILQLGVQNKTRALLKSLCFI